mmetsp:Transcript_40271/g.87837  ORF Transcript_40271/g.87837 Transcript_40271/m.87837 type:complete len:80 (-) Transcript_40271:42-281(-)
MCFCRVFKRDLIGLVVVFFHSHRMRMTILGCVGGFFCFRTARQQGVKDGPATVGPALRSYSAPRLVVCVALFSLRDGCF